MKVARRTFNRQLCAAAAAGFAAPSGLSRAHESRKPRMIVDTHTNIDRTRPARGDAESFALGSPLSAVRRRGFTLIELLVVIAIIGILIALLLPAVQGAQEAARRTQCANNLYQLAMAVQNYDGAYGHLPTGVKDPGPGPIQNVAQGMHQGWLLELLPYMEQQTTYKNFDFTRGVYDPVNAGVRSVTIPTLICPSQGNPKAGGVGVTNYAGCHHDKSAPIGADDNGVFFLNSRIRSSDIEDGLSNTIFIGEKLTGAGDLGWVSGTSASLRNTGVPIDAAPPVGANVVGGFESRHSAVAIFAFGDGHVQGVQKLIALPTLQQLGHRADGKLLDWPAL